MNAFSGQIYIEYDFFEKNEYRIKLVQLNTQQKSTWAFISITRLCSVDFDQESKERKAGYILLIVPYNLKAKR